MLTGKKLDWNTMPPLFGVEYLRKDVLKEQIGRNTLYELVRQESFPARKLGSKIVIHRDGLRKWLDELFDLNGDA
ncbi:MAG TPA: helix-turn-helix domain-containing protein [Syntrophomonadaceae bacterium]|nr:helix-turn-helix domain-containing protein [Syntrophomonadaceae bacterium]